MKKRLLLFCISVMVLQLSHSQEIGVRFGDIVTNTFAIDGVFAFQSGRIHADVSFGKNGVGIEALYDFLYKPIGGEAFFWYVGAGVYTLIGDPFLFGIPGELGLEYRFNTVPLVLGADWRPSIGIVNDFDFFADRFGVNIRWAFNQGG